MVGGGALLLLLLLLLRLGLHSGCACGCCLAAFVGVVPCGQACCNLLRYRRSGCTPHRQDQVFLAIQVPAGEGEDGLEPLVLQLSLRLLLLLLATIVLALLRIIAKPGRRSKQSLECCTAHFLAGGTIEVATALTSKVRFGQEAVSRSSTAAHGSSLVQARTATCLCHAPPRVLPPIFARAALVRRPAIQPASQPARGGAERQRQKRRTGLRKDEQ